MEDMGNLPSFPSRPVNGIADRSAAFQPCVQPLNCGSEHRVTGIADRRMSSSGLACGDSCLYHAWSTDQLLLLNGQLADDGLCHNLSLANLRRASRQRVANFRRSVDVILGVADPQGGRVRA